MSSEPDSEDLISSEVGAFVNHQNGVSIFRLKAPSWWPEHSVEPGLEGAATDDDGDFVVPRSEHPDREATVHIHHQLKTDLANVGQQVWRGSLLMADYLLHHRDLVKDQSVLEVGAGAGLVSITAALCGADRVLATDLQGPVLRMLEANIGANVRSGCGVGQVTVAPLDLLHPLQDEAALPWAQADLILAADVIYDDRLTDGLMQLLLRWGLRLQRVQLLLAMEKRYNFTLSDLDMVAPAYEYLMTRVEDLKAQLANEGLHLSVQHLGLDFPHSFCYERSPDLCLLFISVQPVDDPHV